MYFNVFFKIKKVHLLVSELYTYIRSSGMLHGVDWLRFKEVSEQPIGPKSSFTNYKSTLFEIQGEISFTIKLGGWLETPNVA